jgi:alpha-L-arabinofuranosidase
MCEEAGVLAIVTVNNKESASDMADIIKYSYGDAANTTCGKRRAEDGHPAPYKNYWLEVGNEQSLDASLLGDVVANAQAMRDRAKAMVGGRGWGTANVITSGAGTDGVGVYFDFHIGGDDPATAELDWRTIDTICVALQANSWL